MYDGKGKILLLLNNYLTPSTEYKEYKLISSEENLLQLNKNVTSDDNSQVNANTKDIQIL